MWLDVTGQVVAEQLMNEPVTVKHEWSSRCQWDKGGLAGELRLSCFMSLDSQIHYGFTLCCTWVLSPCWVMSVLSYTDLDVPTHPPPPDSNHCLLNPSLHFKLVLNQPTDRWWMNEWMFCLYSPVNIKFNKSFSQSCIANKLQIAVSQFLQRFMPRNFQKYFMFAKIISMLANARDAPFFPPFSWFQNSLSVTCRTKSLPPPPHSHWLSKALPTLARTDASPLVHKAQPSGICWDTHCWPGIKVASDRPWLVVWALSTAHTGCSISCDSVILKNYWHMHPSWCCHVGCDVGVVLSKVNVFLWKI